MKQLLFSICASLLFISCDQMSGSGNIITEKRQTGEFKGISAGSAFDVEVKAGPVTEVVVESDDNLIKYIETEVTGGILKISSKSNIGINSDHMKVYITAPEINSIKSSGASQVKVLDPLKSQGKITLDVSGAGNINAAVDAPEIYAEVSGAGKIDLSGRTRNYLAEVSGSGDLQSGNLQSEMTDVKVSGAGSAHVHASVNLKAKASGAGNVYYKGGGSVQRQTSGAGNIKKID